MRSGVVLLLWCSLLVPLAHAWGSSGGKDRVLLREVTALTLEQGKMTTGRRSSPVQQLKCVGGSAGCSYSMQPRVVQCHNRGFDGYDVQWECKAELDSKYQFGRLQVSCEGYDYPDDPYILRGSCGLEYELDLTQSGQYKGYHHDNYHGDYHYSAPPNYHHNTGWSWGGLIAMVVVGFFLYQVLKACMAAGSRQGMATGTYAGSQAYSSPPPSGTGGTDGGWGGFWTGAATGGALGYLFGNRGGRGYGYGPSWGTGYSTGYRPGWGSSGWGSSGWGSSGWSSPRPRSGGFGGGGGSRTTSGFGGTSRR